MRLKLNLKCEATSRWEKTGGFLPDALFRVRILQADARYDKLVIEHVAGIGGEAAKVLGDLFKGSLEQWRPSLERELLAKADAAIVKAGDTKEVRVRLSSVLK